jgi:hypothetical protein
VATKATSTFFIGNPLSFTPRGAHDRASLHCWSPAEV